ncbi:unnamed protein product [Rotaria socialis]|uniref:G-protein coupled receptors family 1 profile domain-containing protein n=1 Tax=Rotaria socialis TaxID=392032 RepID=A0A820GZ70_9BILA|nr:unnamed protein product [Rotaria socialis]CAF3182200.1 unnamed protein product [Rotaria socialis]CAF3380437.1 unnamed protein product [Rotaria socialis]CAF3413015.1 unnamed protein product [Rotaria socialis]CAF4145397.1 unnamed protein product [Rotaria socialis]
MHGNVSSDAVAADEDTTALILIDNSGLIFSATQQYSNSILVISYHWPALILSFFSIIGVIGNLLVCLAIATERRLQNRTNWFLFSLAFADMLVSGLVIPLAVVKEFTGFWILGPVLCDLWIFLDVCSCTSSIMHIVVISIDRYLAINDPLNTRTRQQKCKIHILIILVWLIAILLSSPMIVLGAINPYNIFIDGQCLINNQFFVIYGSVVSFVIPLIIVIIMYTLTVRRLKEQIRQCQTQLAQEQLARAASLVAKPFLRRHIPTRDAAAAAQVNAAQWTPIAALASRRMHLRANQMSLELSEESADSTSLQQQKQPTLLQQQQDRTDQVSQIEEKGVIGQNLTQQSSIKTSPHIEYNCPKNPFCQLKCTCHHQQQQQQEKQPPLETVSEPESYGNYLKYFRCCRTNSSSPSSRRRDSSNSYPISLTASTQPKQFLTSRKTTRRTWHRLTITPNVGVSRAKSSAVRNEQKAVKVLGVVFVIFVIAWFPFCILNLLQGVCQRCSVNPNILNGFVWLGYVSSTINPLVYTIFNRNFRLKFIALLKCHCVYSSSRHRYLSSHQSHMSSHRSRPQGRNGVHKNEHRHLNTYYEQQELKLLNKIPSDQS